VGSPDGRRRNPSSLKRCVEIAPRESAGNPVAARAVSAAGSRDECRLRPVIQPIVIGSMQRRRSNASWLVVRRVEHLQRPGRFDWFEQCYALRWTVADLEGDTGWIETLNDAARRRPDRACARRLTRRRYFDCRRADFDLAAPGSDQALPAGDQRRPRFRLAAGSAALRPCPPTNSNPPELATVLHIGVALPQGKASRIFSAVVTPALRIVWASPRYSSARNWNLSHRHG